jgi:hypothetical protein
LLAGVSASRHQLEILAGKPEKGGEPAIALLPKEIAEELPELNAN